MPDEATPPLTVEQMRERAFIADAVQLAPTILARDDSSYTERALALGVKVLTADAWAHGERLTQSQARVARLEAALQEIASQCHNIPRGATAHRIEEIARAALSASTERVSDADS